MSHQVIGIVGKPSKHSSTRYVQNSEECNEGLTKWREHQGDNYNKGHWNGIEQIVTDVRSRSWVFCKIICKKY